MPTFSACTQACIQQFLRHSQILASDGFELNSNVVWFQLAGGYDPYGGGDGRGMLYDRPPGEDGRRVSEGGDGGEVDELLSSQQFRQEVGEIVKEQMKLNASAVSDLQGSPQTYGKDLRPPMQPSNIR